MAEKTEKLCGYNINTSSKKELLDYALERINKGLDTHIVTINPEMIQTALNSNDFSEVIKNAELVIPDGVGIKIGLMIKGHNIQRIAGIEFAHDLLKIAAEKDLSVGFIGAKAEVLDKATANLMKKFTNLKVVYKQDGYFKPEEEQKVIENINNSNAKILFVALGSPKQEFFINKLKQTSNGRIYIGVGGSFDVWSGYVKRAPVIFQKFGLEWLYRTVTQPSRLKRIFPTLPLFVFRVIMWKEKNS